jgi:phosphate transport system protein
VSSRDLEEKRLLEMIERMYDLVDSVLSIVSEGSVGRLKDIEGMVALVEEYRNNISSQATLFIARFQPLAEDLILAESVISVAYDLYRVSRYAREIALLAERIGGLRGNVNEDALRALEIARSMVREAVEAFTKGKREYVEEVNMKDSLVDEVYHKYLDMLRGSDSLSSRDATSLLLARHVERIADHATYIAMSAKRLWRI